jgi:hypothetical protein
VTRREELQQLVARVREGIATKNRAIYEDQSLRAQIDSAIARQESHFYGKQSAWVQVYADLKEIRSKLGIGQYDLSVHSKRRRE